MSLLHRLTAQVPTLVLARRNLSRAGARSALAVAAVVIGVVAIGAIGVGGEAFKQDQLEAYEGFGGTATVSPVFDPADEDFGRTFDDRDVARISQATRGSTVLPVVNPSGIARTSSGQLLFTATIKGIDDPGDFYEAQSGEIPANFRRSVVIGSRVADNNDLEPGDSLTVLVAGEFERTFRVAAVLKPKGFADPLNADRTVFVPTAQFEDPEYGQVILRANSPTVSMTDESERVEREFNVRGRNVDAQPVQEQRELFESFFTTLNQFLIGVGAISLLVAAVTIANTMLMSAIERESEIGVLRAVGFPKFAVVRLLVAEATILGAIGGAVGVPFALAIGAVINELLLGAPLAFTASGLRYVGVGVVFGIVTSLVAGVYPAWKAANKRPVEALN